MELVRWARASHITHDILSRLWHMYVQTGGAWGIALATLSGPQCASLDQVQLMAARRILGYKERARSLRLAWSWAGNLGRLAA